MPALTTAFLLSAATLASCARPPLQASTTSAAPRASGARPPQQASTTSSAIPPCPSRPPFTTLPSPLPAAVTAALAAVASLFTSTLNPVSLPGGSLSISYRGGALLALHGGLACKAPPSNVSAATLFRVASVSKVFPALLAHVLADGGKLGLDDPVAAHLPAFVRPRSPFAEEAGQPTLRHLMSHMAGLQREAPPGNATADVLSAVAASLLIAPPGSGPPSYSNLGFALLGYAAEGAAGGGALLPALVEAHITRPLQLGGTGYDYPPAVMARLAAGYDGSGAAVPFADLGWGYAAGAMHSTAADLDALAQAVLPPATRLPLSPPRAREFWAPVFWARDGLSGMGTPWEFLSVANYSAAVKGGNLPGYTAFVAAVPDVGLSLAATFNGGGVDEFAFAQTALAALLPALEAAFAAAAPQPYNPGPSPADYVGTYALAGTEVLVEAAPTGALLWRNGAIGVSVALDWVAADPVLGDVFRAAFPDSSFSCLAGELEGLRGQYVVFQRDCDTGNVSSTSWPGVVPGAVWAKTAVGK